MKKILALILFFAAFVTAHAQQPVNGLELPYGVKVLDTLATDAWYGPYPDVETALESIPEGVRNNRTVKIDTLEYWWRDGSADEDLIVKTSPGGGVDITVVMDSIAHAVDTLVSMTQADSLYWKTRGTFPIRDSTTIDLNGQSLNFTDTVSSASINIGYKAPNFLNNWTEYSQEYWNGTTLYGYYLAGKHNNNYPLEQWGPQLIRTNVRHFTDSWYTPGNYIIGTVPGLLFGHKYTSGGEAYSNLRVDGDGLYLYSYYPGSSAAGIEFKRTGENEDYVFSLNDKTSLRLARVDTEDLPTSANSSNLTGALIFDTDTNTPKYHDGEDWVAVASGEVEVYNGLTTGFGDSGLDIGLGGNLTQNTSISATDDSGTYWLGLDDGSGRSLKFYSGSGYKVIEFDGTSAEGYAKIEMEQTGTLRSNFNIVAGVNSVGNDRANMILKAHGTSEEDGTGNIYIEPDEALILQPGAGVHIPALQAPTSETYIITINDEGFLGSVEIPSSAITLTQVMDSITNSIDTLVSVTQMMDSLHNAIDTLSAGGSTNATAIRGVTVDASASSPSDGDILVYRSAGSDWVLEEKPSGGGGGGVEIAEVMDSIANAIDTLVSFNQIEAMLDTLDTGGSPDWGDIGGTLSAQTDLQNALDAKASLSGATFTGKASFTTDGTNAGLNIGGHTTNPSGRTNYDLWFETNNNRFMFRRSATDYVVSHFAVGDIGAGRIPILTSDGTGRFNTNSNLTFSSSTLSTPNISVSTGATLPAATSIGDVSSTEIGYLDNVTSSIQTQLNSKQTIAPTTSTGSAVAFDTNRSYCTSASPCTGNITFNSSGAVVGQFANMIHNDSSEPTFGSEFIILSGAYEINEDNYIMFFLRESGKVWVTISQEQ